MENIPPCLELSFNEPTFNKLSSHTLIGKLITNKIVNFKAIDNVLQTTWNLGVNVSIKPIDRNMISYTFRKASDRDRIKETGPWSIKGALLNMQKGFPELSFEEVTFSFCQFWIQIHNLPSNIRNEDNLFKLGNFIGIYQRLDDEQQTRSLRKFVCIRVVVDTRKSLVQGVSLHVKMVQDCG